MNGMVGFCNAASQFLVCQFPTSCCPSLVRLDELYSSHSLPPSPPAPQIALGDQPCFASASSQLLNLNDAIRDAATRALEGMMGEPKHVGEPNCIIHAFSGAT